MTLCMKEGDQARSTLPVSLTKTENSALPVTECQKCIRFQAQDKYKAVAEQKWHFMNEALAI